MADLQRLRECGIDTDEGLACCADDPDFYEEMLAEYAAEGRTLREELRRAFESRDWKSYAICAHTVKSTSKMIGANGFAEEAYRMELAGKAQDGEAVSAGHAAFLEAYGRLLGQIASARGES